MGTATRVCVDNYEAYPGIFRVSFDSGDVRAAAVLTTPTVGCVRGGMKHPAAPCPARYKHTTCGVVVEASLAGRRAGCS